MESANDPVAVPILKPPHTRVAILDGGGFSIQDVVSGDFHEFRERVAELVLGALSGHTFSPPETALREILDNLVHAVPCSASVVVDPSLERVYISDTGPGIIHPDLAMEPGYTTATEVHRSVIRGVGLGFYLARKEVEEIGVCSAIPGRGLTCRYVSTAALRPRRILMWECHSPGKASPIGRTTSSSCSPRRSSSVPPG